MRISMTLAEIPGGSLVFIDANVFIYHFAAQSEECSTFLSQVETGYVRGTTGRTILLEVARRLMVLEAIEQGLGVGANPAQRLARRSDVVRGLSRYYFSMFKIPQMGVGELLIPQDYLTRSQEYRQAYG
jgi:hypothetical protein